MPDLRGLRDSFPRKRSSKVSSTHGLYLFFVESVGAAYGIYRCFSMESCSIAKLSLGFAIDK